MPPKKAIEAPPAAEAPDQPPSFDTDSFVDSLLMMAKKRELALLEEGVAAAVGMADDFRVNLRNGVVVDFTVECVLFASQHGFNARKTAGFIKWMTELRTCVETTGDIDKAKTLFRTHVIASAERNALASSARRLNRRRKLMALAGSLLAVKQPRRRVRPVRQPSNPLRRRPPTPAQACVT
jgi:hypothetical protein